MRRATGDKPMSHVEEITEKLIQMMTAESEWVKTGVELEEVHNGIRRVAEGVAPHVERLLADEREPMECGHPKACLVQREISNIEKNEGPLNDTEYCSACVERERVRERCAGEVVKTWCKFRDAKRKPMVRDLLSNLEQVILQLDLTKDLAPSREEGKGG